MRGQVLDVRLPPRAVRGRLIERKAALLQYQTGVVTLRYEFDLDDGLIILARRHGHQQPPGRIAYVNPARAFPAASEACPKLAAQLEIAFHLSDPARQPLRISERRPQVLGIGAEAIFHADDSLAVSGMQ